jgi:hypothetical protein
LNIKEDEMKKSILAMTFALSTQVALAQAMPQTQGQSNGQINNKADAKTTDKVVEKSKLILDQATSAMNDTKSALNFLDQNKTKDAQKALQSATGKIEMVVARKPAMGMAPFDINVVTNDLISDPATVNKLKDQAISSLQAGNVQEARRILSGLRSETIISVASIPLATYPAALKDAARLIDQNKVAEAKMAITSALSTVVMSETIVPLPLARADFYIDDASKLTSDSTRGRSENEQITKDIDSAKQSLQMAEALGYAPKDAFKDTYSKLDDLSDRAKKGESGDNFFKDVKNKISSYYSLNDSQTIQAQEADQVE